MSLRDFLSILEKNSELIKIKKEVSPKFELSAVTQKIQMTVNKAVLFEKVKGYSSPIVSNLLGDYKKVAMSLGCSENQIIDVLSNRWELVEPVDLIGVRLAY